MRFYFEVMLWLSFINRLFWVALLYRAFCWISGLDSSSFCKFDRFAFFDLGKMMSLLSSSAFFSEWTILWLLLKLALIDKFGDWRFLPTWSELIAYFPFQSYDGELNFPSLSLELEFLIETIFNFGFFVFDGMDNYWWLDALTKSWFLPSVTMLFLGCCWLVFGRVRYMLLFVSKGALCECSLAEEFLVEPTLSSASFATFGILPIVSENSWKTSLAGFVLLLVCWFITWIVRCCTLIWRS